MGGDYGAVNSPFQVEYDLLAGLSILGKDLMCIGPVLCNNRFCLLLCCFSRRAWATGQIGVHHDRYYGGIETVLIAVERLSGEACWPAPVEDAAAALNYVRKTRTHGDRWQSNWRLGSSAGAHLAG